LTKLVQSRAGKTVALELLREGKPQEIKIAPELRQNTVAFINDTDRDGTWDLTLTNSNTVFLPNVDYTAFAPQVLNRNLTYMLANDSAATGNAVANASSKVDGGASVDKKIDELSAEIKELRKAIELLAKSQANK
jgi:hypothetical protein